MLIPGTRDDDLPAMMELELVGAHPEATKMAGAARILAQFATDPKTPWTIRGIARASGISQAEVEVIFSQDWFAEVLRRQAVQECARLNLLGLQVIEDVMRDPEASNTMKLNAAKASFSAYKTLVESFQKDESDDAELLLKEKLARFRKTRARVRAETKEVARAGAQRMDRSPPAPEAGADARHPAPAEQ